MSALKDEEVDRAVREFLATELDPETGRASVRFAREVQREAMDVRRQARMFWWGMSAAAAIAAIGVFVVLNGWRSPAPVDQKSEPVVANLPANSIPIASSPAKSTDEIWMRDVDDGIVVIGEKTPYRKIRRQIFQNVRETSAGDGVTIPQENIIFVAEPVH